MLATLGYDPTFGARPLKRVIQKRVLDPLAMGLLNGRLHEGETVTLSVGDDGEFPLTGQLTEAPVVA
jgi:ATP-dependent Clp protease ATP-binding subunit ClpB